MNTEESATIAQLAEQFLQRTALAVLLMALAYGLGAAMYLADGALRQGLDLAQTALAILAMVIVLPGFVRIVRLRLRGDCDISEADSYIGQVFRKACVMGFSITFVLLVATGPLLPMMPADLPVNFYIQCLLAASLGVFSATFFTALWRDRNEPDDEVDGDEQ